MIGTSTKESVLIAALFLLGFAPLHAGAEKELTTGQRFFFDTVAGRRSVRSFTGAAVSDEHLLKILDAARLAATSGNQQPWKFLVVRAQERREALKRACLELAQARIEASAALDAAGKSEQRKKFQTYYDTCFSAPLFVVVLVDRESRYPDYNRYDGPMAAANLMLAARALGYGTVFYTDTIPEEVTRRVLQIPARYEQVCITPIGVPAEWPKAPSKKDLSEFIVYDSFSGE